MYVKEMTFNKRIIHVFCFRIVEIQDSKYKVIWLEMAIQIVHERKVLLYGN